MLPPPFLAMEPADELAWFAVADWLEENDDPRRAELTRLTHLLRHDLDHPDRLAREDRLLELLAAGVEPCVATMTNSIGMEFVYVPAGVFFMGSPLVDLERCVSELPAHEVEITRGFWLGKYPVTQAEYEAVMGKNPSYYSAGGAGKERIQEVDSSRLPVETVSYENAVSFCRKVGRLDRNSGQKRSYRLPTEAQWEYACRGGVSTIRLFFPSPYMWREDICPSHCVPSRTGGTALGRFRPNAFGLHDMPGNLWEMCSDWSTPEYDPKAVKKDPSGPPEGICRVTRGGSAWSEDEFTTLPARDFAGGPEMSIGFRVCFACPS